MFPESKPPDNERFFSAGWVGHYPPTAIEDIADVLFLPNLDGKGRGRSIHAHTHAHAHAHTHTHTHAHAHTHTTRFRARLEGLTEGNAKCFLTLVANGFKTRRVKAGRL